MVHLNESSEREHHGASTFADGMLALFASVGECFAYDDVTGTHLGHCSMLANSMDYDNVVSRRG